MPTSPSPHSLAQRTSQAGYYTRSNTVSPIPTPRTSPFSPRGGASELASLIPHTRRPTFTESAVPRPLAAYYEWTSQSDIPTARRPETPSPLATSSKEFPEGRCYWPEYFGDSDEFEPSVEQPHNVLGVIPPPLIQPGALPTSDGSGPSLPDVESFSHSPHRSSSPALDDPQEHPNQQTSHAHSSSVGTDGDTMEQPDSHMGDEVPHGTAVSDDPGLAGSSENPSCTQASPNASSTTQTTAGSQQSIAGASDGGTWYQHFLKSFQREALSALSSQQAPGGVAPAGTFWRADYVQVHAFIPGPPQAQDDTPSPVAVSSPPARDNASPISPPLPHVEYTAAPVWLPLEGQVDVDAACQDAVVTANGLCNAIGYLQQAMLKEREETAAEMGRLRAEAAAAPELRRERDELEARCTALESKLSQVHAQFERMIHMF
ncbi:hypothetical protein BD413DRAFT_581218 [Trametes elegans]|nr:hypothetical protein BD413DRAFT_581218 [Trametes elegans]